MSKATGTVDWLRICKHFDRLSLRPLVRRRVHGFVAAVARRCGLARLSNDADCGVVNKRLISLIGRHHMELWTWASRCGELMLLGSLNDSVNSRNLTSCTSSCQIGRMSVPRLHTCQSLLIAHRGSSQLQPADTCSPVALSGRCLGNIDDAYDNTWQESCKLLPARPVEALLRTLVYG